MSTNPFEPPRTSDLEGASVPGALALSEAALQELSASAGWARRFAHITLISIVVAIVDTAIGLFAARDKVGTVTPIISVIFGTGISIAYLAVLRRYATAAERLRAGARQAAVDVVAAQTSYFKLSGVITIVALALLVLALVAGIVAGRLAAGRS